MEKVKVEHNSNGVATIILNRPNAANALSIQLLTELKSTIYELSFDQSTRVVIITGAGEKAFCAGADLKEREGMDLVQTRKTLTLIRDVINSFANLPQPTIAAINGYAFGGGTELALAADIRIAAERAKMGLTETSLGIIPGAGGTQRLPRLIGIGKAKELIFTARHIATAEAEQIGLVDYRVPNENLIDKCMDIANLIAQNAPLAIARAKQAIDKGVEVDLNTGLTIEQTAYELIISTQDRLEGLKAFKEKRKPIYKGE